MTRIPSVGACSLSRSNGVKDNQKSIKQYPWVLFLSGRRMDWFSTTSIVNPHLTVLYSLPKKWFFSKHTLNYHLYETFTWSQWIPTFNFFFFCVLCYPFLLRRRLFLFSWIIWMIIWRTKKRFSIFESNTKQRCMKDTRNILILIWCSHRDRNKTIAMRMDFCKSCKSFHETQKTYRFDEHLRNEQIKLRSN